MTLLHILKRPPRHLALLTRRHASNIPSATAKADTNTPKSSSTTSSTPLSSCVADTKIEGVNFLKGQAPVLALPDDEYPEWLWTVLQPKVHVDDGPGGKAERVKRRAENKQRIKDRNFMSTQ